MAPDPRTLLRAMFDQAVDAALPASILADYLPERPEGRTVVVGAGKASAAMATALEEAWEGPLEGLVVTRYDHAVPCERIRIVEAAHPVPDAAGERAAGDILRLVRDLGPEDLVIALISGGGSALLALPAPGLTLKAKQNVNEALLRSGASIDEMNSVRKHLSEIKGGRLAVAAAPAKVVTLVISDVPGDDPSVIASGPTVADASTLSDARDILNRYGIEVDDAVRHVLEDGSNETPKADDPRLQGTELRMIATPQASLEAAARVARDAGVEPLILGDAIEGEASQVAKVMAGIALQAKRHGQPTVPPTVLISGGETTVSVRGSGRGGRNVEFLLALALKLNGAAGIYAIAGDTDGIDGAESVAGAVVTPDTLLRAGASGLDGQAMLRDNDAHSFFERLGDQVITGPTLTNVNDFRAVLVLNQEPKEGTP
ncbi:MAG: glycerate kinase [Geminicoccaceae bacterium]